MRLSVEDRNGPDFEKAQMVFNTDVYLNGVIAQNVTVADEEGGYIVCHTMDVNNRPILNEARDGILDHIEIGVVKLVDRRKRDLVRT